MDGDKYKARLFLHYLGSAKNRFDEKAFARKKLQLQLRALRRMSTESLKKHIDKLERNIAEAIDKEKKIMTTQKGEELFHSDLRQKMERLESKLGRYLSTKDARQRRIQELEEKVKVKTRTKREELHALREELKRLEKLYRIASKAKGMPKTKLKRIKARIITLKEKLKVMG